MVTQALDAGHEVTVLVRSPEKIPVRHARLHVTVGSVTDDDGALARAVTGHDAVLSALGRGTSFTSNGLIEASVPPIVSAMRSAGVRRLIFTSAIGVGEAIEDAPIFSKIMVRLLLKDIYADKAAGEALIRQSNLDWTVVQPAQLTNGPLTRRYQVGDRLKLTGIPRISRADLAHFLLAQLDDTAYVRNVARIGY